MEFSQLLNALTVTNTYHLGAWDIVFAISVPFFLMFFVSTTYRVTQKNINYSVAFIHSLFLFSCLTSVVTLIIGSNIARAFGLIGALSIIRFRNALKSPADTVYIFWSLCVGMACGTGFYLAAILLTVLCCGFMLILHFSGYGNRPSSSSLVRVVLDGSAAESTDTQVETLLKSVGRFQKENMIFDSSTNTKSLVYSLRPKRKSKLSLLNTLEKMKGIRSFQLLKEDSRFVAA